MKSEIKSFINFTNEAMNIGKREQAKIDELLDMMSKRPLSEEEKGLLQRLYKGEVLPAEEKEKPVLKQHKTGGGFIFDEEGNIVVQGGGENNKPGQEFTTSKGKIRQIDKLSSKKDMLNARVYKNRESEERFFYCYITVTDEAGATSNDWIIYRTGGGDKFPFGQFLDTNAPKYNFFKRMSPEQLWKELDYSWDFGMVLDEDLYENLMNFARLYKENQAKNSEALIAIRNRFLKLL